MIFLTFRVGNSATPQFLTLPPVFAPSYGRVYAAADPYHHTIGPAATYSIGTMVRALPPTYLRVGLSGKHAALGLGWPLRVKREGCWETSKFTPRLQPPPQHCAGKGSLRRRIPRVGREGQKHTTHTGPGADPPAFVATRKDIHRPAATFLTVSRHPPV